MPTRSEKRDYMMRFAILFIIAIAFNRPLSAEELPKIRCTGLARIKVTTTTYDSPAGTPIGVLDENVKVPIEDERRFVDGEMWRNLGRRGYYGWAIASNVERLPCAFSCLFPVDRTSQILLHGKFAVASAQATRSHRGRAL